MTPSPVRHAAQLLAQITDPQAILQILDKLFDVIAPIVMRALIEELTKLLEKYVNEDDLK